jgi:hypothetical protein
MIRFLQDFLAQYWFPRDHFFFKSISVQEGQAVNGRNFGKIHSFGSDICCKFQQLRSLIPTGKF